MIKYKVQERQLVSKKEYALYANAGRDSWVLYTWDKKPSKEDVDTIIFWLRHTMEFAQTYAKIAHLKVRDEEIQY